MTKRNVVLVVTILAIFSADSTVRADRLFQGRIIKRLFGVEDKSPSKLKEAKKKKAKKKNDRDTGTDATSESPNMPRSFQSKGFGLQVKTKGKRLTVVSVAANGMAKKAGIRVGDQIVKVAGANVDNVLIFREIEKVLEPGNEVEIVLKRSGKRETVPISFVKTTTQDTSEPSELIAPPAEPLPPQEPTPAVAPSEEQQPETDQSILRFPEELIPS